MTKEIRTFWTITYITCVDSSYSRHLQSVAASQQQTKDTLECSLQDHRRRNRNVTEEVNSKMNLHTVPLHAAQNVAVIMIMSSAVPDRENTVEVLFC